MRKKFLSVILSLSMVATAVTPCFAVEKQIIKEPNKTAVVEKRLQEAVNYCNADKARTISFFDVVKNVIITFSIGFAGAWMLFRNVGPDKEAVMKLVSDETSIALETIKQLAEVDSLKTIYGLNELDQSN